MDDSPPSPNPPLALPLRQEAFCRHYAGSGVGAVAARLAGYASDGARQQASRLLTYPHIRNRVEALRTEMTQRHCLSGQALLAKLEACFRGALHDHQYLSAVRAVEAQTRLCTRLIENGGDISNEMKPSAHYRHKDNKD